MLADIFPTGYHATSLAQVGPGETVTVMGAGPVGLMAAYSSIIKGAAQVFVVDKVPHRLALAEKIGAIPVNLSDGDVAEQIRDQTGGDGSDKGIDAVGFQATADEGEEQPAVVLNTLVEVVRATGMLGVVGLYVPSDPGAPNEEAGRGELLFKVGKFFEKGLRMGSGQANVKADNRHLRDLDIAGRAGPSRASWSPRSCRWIRRPRPTSASTSARRVTPRSCCTRRDEQMTAQARTRRPRPQALAGAYLAELIGTFVFVFSGTATVLAVHNLSHTTAGFTSVGDIAISLAFAFGVLAVVYTTAAISGAHLNPGGHDRSGGHRGVPVAR